VDELGNLLREAREAKGLTLLDAQEATRINSSYLEALEAGQYDALPTPVHARGYLRNYARYLKLDPEPLLERYEVKRGQQAVTSPSPNNGAIGPNSPLPTREDQPFFDPVNMNLSNNRGSKSGSLQRWIIIIALLLSIALIASRIIPLLRGNGGGTESLTNGIQEAVSNLTSGNEAEASPSPDTSNIPGAAAVVTSTNRNAAIQLPTATATRPSLPATLELIELRLDITERTWMRITIDGEVAFEGLAKKGDEPYQWTAEEEAQLLTGNAIGIFATINDIPLGKLGGRGEVVEEIWETTSN
jgi:cytoskeletal protein RodZ